MRPSARTSKRRNSVAELFPADKLFLIAGPCVLESDELDADGFVLDYALLEPVERYIETALDQLAGRPSRDGVDRDHG